MHNKNRKIFCNNDYWVFLKQQHLIKKETGSNQIRTELIDIFLEYMQVLFKFYKVFEIIFNNEIECVSYRNDILKLSGIRLLKYLYNNYYDILFSNKYYYNFNALKLRRSKINRTPFPDLSGSYIDQIILDPMYMFLSYPNDNVTFQDLCFMCLHVLEEYLIAELHGIEKNN